MYMVYTNKINRIKKKEVSLEIQNESIKIYEYLFAFIFLKTLLDYTQMSKLSRRTISMTTNRRCLEYGFCRLVNVGGSLAHQAAVFMSC